MYAYFKGIVKYIDIEKVVLEVSNIGYNIFMPQDELTCLKLEEEQIIYTQFVHREDDMRLFGFLTMSKLEFFKKLTSVSGVGSKVALGIISNISEVDICTAIVTENISLLKSVPGIGPKMAGKIIFELKDKIKTEDLIVKEKTGKVKNTNIDEAMSALAVLGYTSKELRDIADNNDFDDLSVEDIIKRSLKLLHK